MGFLEHIIERRWSVGDSFHPSSPSSWWSELFGGGRTSAGVEVDEWKALNLSTVWICVNSIATDVAKLSFHTYKRVPGGRERADEQPTQRLLNVQANPEMSAIDFRSTLGWWVLNWGNGYAEIERTRGGKPVALWPLEPWCVKVKRVSGSIVYEYTDPCTGEQTTLPADDVFHLKGLGNGLVGMNVIRFARESMGAAIAAERFGAKFFGDGAHAGFVLSHPGKLGPKGMDNIRDSFKKRHQGLDNSHNPFVLEEGVTIERMTFPPDEAQFLETRAYSVPEICRWFRFPPHKAMDLSRAHYNNVEQSELAYIGDTLLSWMKRWESQANIKLIAPRDQATYYTEHLADASLRADIEKRYAAYATGKQNGWLSANEIRARENMNPLPNGEGDIYTVQVNMTTPAKIAEDPPAPKVADPEPEPEPSKKMAKKQAGAETNSQVRAALAGYAELLEDAYRRALRFEGDRLRRSAAKADVDVTAFYERHAAELTRSLFPIVEAASTTVRVLVGGEIPLTADGSVRAIADALTADHVGVSKREHAAASGPEAIDALAKAWEGTRSKEQAVRHLAILADRLAEYWSVKE